MGNLFNSIFNINPEYEDPEDIKLKEKAMNIAKNLSGHELDTLHRAWSDGLMESGSTPSKDGRALLLKKGVLCQTAYKGCDYTFSVTYPLGYYVCVAAEIVSDE